MGACGINMASKELGYSTRHGRSWTERNILHRSNMVSGGATSRYKEMVASVSGAFVKQRFSRRAASVALRSDTAARAMSVQAWKNITRCDL